MLLPVCFEQKFNRWPILTYCTFKNVLAFFFFIPMQPVHLSRYFMTSSNSGFRQMKAILSPTPRFSQHYFSFNATGVALSYLFFKADASPPHVQAFGICLLLVKCDCLQFPRSSHKTEPLMHSTRQPSARQAVD